MINLKKNSKSSVDSMMYDSISDWSHVNANDFAQALKKAEDEGRFTGISGHKNI